MTLRLPFRICDVFTDVPLAGNQLGVFTDAAQLDGKTMQRLARELNFSESTFVVGRQGDRARVRIFTPETELPFAGHPSLGTAAVLQPEGRIVLELGVGDVPVEVQRTPYGARAELTAVPAKQLDGTGAPDGKSLATALGLHERDLDPTLPCEVWSCGNAFAFVPLRSVELVAKTRCPRDPIGDLVGIMPFALPAALEAHARVFCPGAGVPEDPATGSANAPFAAYLHAHGRLAAGETMTTRQGVEMGRPSTLSARMVDGRARVAGGVVIVAEGMVSI